MRILEPDSDTTLNRITIFLTKAEAQELRDSLESLIKNPTHHHEHIPSDDYEKELTITVYDSQSIESYDERSRKLISNDD